MMLKPFSWSLVQGVFSDIFVVKGIEIGHENVSVHLLEPQLKNLTDQIILTVAEAMSLDPPSPVFALVGALIPYTLKVIRENVPQGFLFIFLFLIFYLNLRFLNIYLIMIYAVKTINLLLKWLIIYRSGPLVYVSF